MRKIIPILVAVPVAFLVFTGCTVANAPRPALTPAVTVSAAPTPSAETVQTSAPTPVEVEQVPVITPAPTQEPAPEPEPELTSDSIASLNTLQLVNAVEDGGYNRSEDFGNAWTDVDQNGCDTRNDVLNRDLTNIAYRDGDGCTVATGTLNDPYTGQTINFVRGQETSTAVQIDHIIPLKYAYLHGATAWAQDVRVAFANDPENLLAVDGPSNSSKSAKGPENWMPENTAYTCAYAEKFVNVADKYDVSITTNDYDVLFDALSTCGA